MNNTRMFLYAALGAICLSLWSAWQKDYPVVPETTVASASNVSNKTITQVQTSQTQNTQNNLSIQPNVSKNNDSVRFVTVHTDVLDVAIDTVGGNLVQAKLLKYPVSLQKNAEPMQIMSDSPDNLYIAPSALVGEKGPDLDFAKQAKYSVDEHSYIMAPEQNELIVKLKWRNQDGLFVTKNFVFTRAHYDIKVMYNVDNKGKNAWQGNFYATLQRKSSAEDKGGGMFSFRTFTGAAISSPEKPYEKMSYDNLNKENIVRTIQGGWLALQQRYFLSAWIPDANKSYNYFSQALSDQVYILGLYNSVKVLPGEKVTFGATLYTGPEITASLKALAPSLDMTIDYGWLWWISIAVFWLMQQIYRIVGNWGWSIVIVTLLIKLVFYKFSEKSYHSMAKMRTLAPKFQALKERFGDDKQKMSQATMELYKKEKVNPVGGCLPQLIQIPFFIALYYVLIESVELRHAPFIFWIHDLSAKDPYFIMPILMGLSMLIQQRLNPSPPTADPMQAKMMMFLPVVFTVFFLSFPAGLVLYWLVNNCLSVLQQWYITWQVEKKMKE